MDRSRAWWVGANFLSRSGGRRMWTEYDASIVRQELRVLAEHGCSMTRSFCYWPDFVPEVQKVDERMVARLKDFLDAHVEVGLGTIPTLIVGHMSGENWDPSWRRQRNLYTDVWFVSEQAWFANQIVSRIAQHPAVIGWLISNEIPHYGGPGTTEEITAWARIMVQAVRAGGGHQPVSLGDGAWGVEVTGNDNGFSLRSLAPLVDYFGPHVYPTANDDVRQFLTPAFACELAGSFGRPVVLEEFGVSSDFVSDEHAAHYYRRVLHTCLMAGATGWIAWNNCDFDGPLYDQAPYVQHPFEMHFGVTDSQGEAKPQLREIQRFAQLLDSLDGHDWKPVRDDVAIVVPEHFERTVPFSGAEYSADIREILLQAYVATREADLSAHFAREIDGLGPHQLYLLPSTKVVTGPTVTELTTHVEGGATLYLSFFAGTSTLKRGSWIPWLDELFGVRRSMRHAVIDRIADDDVRLTFVEPFGDIARGEELLFPVAGNDSSRSYLLVEPTEARVVAVDQHGQPALLERRAGQGRTVLCTYPIEHMAARTPAANPEQTWRLYAALATVAGLDRPVRVEDPRVFTGRLQGRAQEVALFVNASSESLQTPIQVKKGADYSRRDDAEVVTELVLPPFGMEVLLRV